MKRKLFSFLMTLILALTLFIPTKITAFAEVPDITATAELDQIKKYGNVVLSTTCTEILDAGYNFGDVVTVSFADQSLDVPFCSNYSDVEAGTPAVFARQEDENVIVAINMGDFASTYKIAIKETAEDNSTTWSAPEGIEYPLTFTISMKDPGAYYDEYQLRQMSYTTNRDDYPDLTDEQFANFRPITTTGIGAGRLFRSASPINPDYNRNIYADPAIKKAGVTVIMNLSDDEATARSYEGFDDTYYSKQKFIALNMGVDFTEKDFKDKFAQGLRFFIDNPGIFEIHCIEGKDRCGFVSAIIESFMGASYDEVIADYATTFYNYYGIKPGDDKYEFVVKNISKTLESSFEVSDLQSADLKAEADEYFTAIGLSEDEKNALRTVLGEAVTEEAEEQAEINSAAPTSSGSTYIVQPGDYLVKIAQEQLGDSKKWAEIYELNKDIIKNPSLIYEGQELKLAE